MDGYQKNVVYLLIALLVLFALFSLFKPPAPAPQPDKEPSVAQDDAAEPEEDFNFGKRKQKVDISKFTSRAEYQQYLNAKRYREVKERQKQEIAAKNAKKARFRTPGVDKMRQGIGFLRDGRNEIAIQEIRRAMASEEGNKALQATGFKYLAQAYQNKDDVPHYCLYMYKYLDLAEDLVEGEEARVVIHKQKVQFRDVINQMKAKGHLE